MSDYWILHSISCTSNWANKTNHQYISDKFKVLLVPEIESKCRPGQNPNPMPHHGHFMQCRLSIKDDDVSITHVSFHLPKKNMFYLKSENNLYIINQVKIIVEHTCLVANLQVKVTWFGVESQVNSVSIVTDDVFSAWILAVASSYKLL